MLFVAWPEQIFRPTGDLDLLGYGDPEPAAIAALFTRICRVAVPDDGILFDATTLKVVPLREANTYRGLSVSVTAELDRARIRVLVDIGFGDHVHPPPKRSAFPGLLPDLPQATVLMYPPETVIAEKFEAIIRFGVTNGRVKDLNDIWVIIHTLPFDLATVIEAVEGTLRRRGTAIPNDMPIGLTETFARIAEARGLWTGFLRRSPPALKPPPLAELQAELRRFFGPVIASLGRPEGARGRWDPAGRAWN